MPALESFAAGLVFQMFCVNKKPSKFKCFASKSCQDSLKIDWNCSQQMAPQKEIGHNY